MISVTLTAIEVTLQLIITEILTTQAIISIHLLIIKVLNNTMAAHLWYTQVSKWKSTTKMIIRGQQMNQSTKKQQPRKKKSIA